MSLYIIDVVSRGVFIFLISYYLLTNLQWYNYSFARVFTKHHKKKWHLWYFVLPIVLFIVFYKFYNGSVFYIYLYLVAVPMMVIWIAKLDKRLIFTKRIIRAFIILVSFVVLNEFLVFFSNLNYYLPYIAYLLPMIFAFGVSYIFEWVLFRNYVKMARLKLDLMNGLNIIAITGSYGKTSIKNFIYEILKEKFIVYATPRSVNTFKGIVDDINKNLDMSTEIYVAEAGARNKGDIAEISGLLNQKYGVIGKIGNAHIEYFKDTENIYETKFEMLYSNNLIKVFSHVYNKIPTIDNNFVHNLEKVHKYPSEIKHINSTLEGTSFELKINGKWEYFETSILGNFNAHNISVAIMVANELKIDMQKIKKAVTRLESIPHRLQKIVTNNKIILDDSFNGNLEGMSEAIRLCSLYDGRKVIVTPGLVEQDEKSNIELSNQIDKVFDLVIITGELNAKILSNNILNTQKVILKDKTQLEDILKAFSKNKDLILFANDAPNYV